jgi:hypothetical protein
MASASSHATMRAACSSRVTSARANARAAPTQPPASTSGRPMATAPAFFRRRVARARRVRAGAEDSSRPLAEPFVTPEDVRRGEVARSWVSELYDCVDYAAVFAAAEEAAVRDDDDDALADDDHSGERMYGEFDMGFFVALLRVLEPELALLEYGDVDGGAVGDGVFVDVGSGRGQLAFLASITRKWQRCVGLEIDPQLHAIATQVSLRSPNEDVRDRHVNRRVPGRGAADDAVTGELRSRGHVRPKRPQRGARKRDARFRLRHEIRRAMYASTKKDESKKKTLSRRICVCLVTCGRT